MISHGVSLFVLLKFTVFVDFCQNREIKQFRKCFSVIPPNVKIAKIRSWKILVAKSVGTLGLSIEHAYHSPMRLNIEHDNTL